MLHEQAATGTAIVLSTHDLDLARDLADQVCLLNGRQYATGQPDETLTAGTCGPRTAGWSTL